MPEEEVAVAAPEMEHSARFERCRSTAPPVESTLSELVIEDVDWQGCKRSHVSLESVILKKVKLARTEFRNVKLRDASVANCDLSNADWTAALFDRVALSSTRLTGFNGAEGKYTNVAFRNCVAPYAVFHTSRLERCRFEGCDLSNATFEGGTLRSVAFRGCDLANVRFVGASLGGIDLRASRIEGIQVELESLKHFTIDALQATDIAALTGIRIRTIELA